MEMKRATPSQSRLHSRGGMGHGLRRRTGESVVKVDTEPALTIQANNEDVRSSET